MIIHWPWHLDFAVSWHFDWIPLAIQLRTYKNGGRNRPVTYGPKEGEDVDYYGRFKKGNMMTSGMYAICVGLHLGYDKIILAGLPFDTSGHFYDPPGNEFETNYTCSNDRAKQTWQEVKDMAGDKIRAVSGNLVSCFGEFTEEWLGDL